jgi:eukaryotic-like serine/threonine-protein kinase
MRYGSGSMADDVFGIVGTTQAGNFHVEQVVAEGGFGVVYRALHAGFRAPVALKCLKVSEARTSRERDLFLEKFREEAQLLFRLSALIPEVVRPLHVDVLHLKDGQFVPFLALEWLEGESLDKVIDRRRIQGEPPIPLQKLMKMMRPIAHAIARAHRFSSPTGTISIIHRDLKPENIFITTQEGVDRLKILDYGIAQAKSLAEQAVGRVTNTDKLNAFSPAYGAPEQWVPKRFGQTGTWTDVWGLALTMVEALVGRQVVEGEPQAMMGTALDTRRRPTPRAEGANISPEIDAVFERALAVDPRDRTRDIETFWSELESALGLALSLGLRSGGQEDAYATVPPPSASMRSPAAKPRVSHVWLDAPKESGSLELDLDSAPASIRSSMARREGSVSVRPPPSDAGMEMDLPEGPPPSVRGRLGIAAPDSIPASVRGRVGVPDSGPASAHLLGGASGPEAGSTITRSRHIGDSTATPVLTSSGRVHDAMAFETDFSASPRATARVPSLPPTSMRPPPETVRPPAEPPPRAAQGLVRQIGVPVLFIVFACALTVTDLIMKSSGPGLSFGPVRSFWVAGVLLLFGVGLFFWRVLEDPGDA